jgi:hypothetical protein
MSLAAWIVAFVVAFTVGGATGIKWEKGQQAQREVAAREQAKNEREAAEKKIDVSAVKHEKEKIVIREEFVVITERIEDAKQTDFYAAGAPACLDARGLSIINDAARPAASAASQPARAVPRPSAATQRSAGDSAFHDARMGTDVQGVQVKTRASRGGLAQIDRPLSSISTPAEGAVVRAESGFPLRYPTFSARARGGYMSRSHGANQFL